MRETDEPEDNVDDDDNNDGEDKEGMDRPTRGSSMGRRRIVSTCTLHVLPYLTYMYVGGCSTVEGVVVVLGEAERWVSR